MVDLWGILLAAGRGQRFGAHKLLHPLAGNVPLGVMAARSLLRAVPNSVAVVREDDQELIRLLRPEGMGIVINTGADRGMGTSLACGVRATAHATGWVIALADMPWISPDSIRGVVRMLHAGAPIAAPVYQGQRGHPVGFSHALRDELLQVAGDNGAREVLARHADLLQLFEVNDPGILRDVDQPGDLTSPADH